MSEVRVGDLYRIKINQGFVFAEGSPLYEGALHLVHEARGSLVYTLSNGRKHTWYVKDLLSFAERVEVHRGSE